MSRVFKTKGNVITQGYKAGVHNGIDLVGTGRTLDYIVAHSEGKVVAVRSNYKTTDKSGSSYGNYIKIKHNNGMYTLYAHLKYGSLKVKNGQRVSKGEVIAYMGATGRATGAHLHFEVRNASDKTINPTSYINADLPSSTTSYSKGNYKTLYVMRVRAGAGTTYKTKTKAELTKDGQKNATEQGCYKKGTIFTAQEIISKGNNEYWAKSPSGYICLRDNKQVYCSKA